MTDAEREARIQAVAHLSSMWALAECVDEALIEAGYWRNATGHVLRAVENVTADGVGGMHHFRVAAVRALVEQAHQEREVTSS